MHGLSINVSSVEWPEETRDGEWGRGNGRDSVSACMKRVLDMERVRTASPLSYTPQEGNAHLRQKLHGWHLVLAKKLAQTVVQAQPFTPALAPLMSMGQPQFDVCILVEPAVHFSYSSSLRKVLCEHVCGWCDVAVGIDK